MKLDWLVVVFFAVAVAGIVVVHRLAPAEHTDDDRAATFAVSKMLELCFVNVVLVGFSAFIASLFGYSLWGSAVDGSLLARLGFGQAPPWLAWTIVGIVIETPIVLVVVSIPSIWPGEIHPFSERQLVAVFSILAFIPWLMATTPAAFRIFNLIVDGALLVIAAVFFVAKSVVVRRVSYGTLAVAVAPLANLVVGTLWSRS